MAVRRVVEYVGVLAGFVLEPDSSNEAGFCSFRTRNLCEMPVRLIVTSNAGRGGNVYRTLAVPSELGSESGAVGEVFVLLPSDPEAYGEVELSRLLHELGHALAAIEAFRQLPSGEVLVRRECDRYREVFSSCLEQLSNMAEICYVWSGEEKGFSLFRSFRACWLARLLTETLFGLRLYSNGEFDVTSLDELFKDSYAGYEACFGAATFREWMWFEGLATQGAPACRYGVGLMAGVNLLPLLVGPSREPLLFRQALRRSTPMLCEHVGCADRGASWEDSIDWWLGEMKGESWPAR